MGKGRKIYNKVIKPLHAQVVRPTLNMFWGQKGLVTTGIADRSVDVIDGKEGIPHLTPALDFF
jgi:hypothetical protein